jgi:N-acyl homoserine lactone hydrolase
MPQVTIDLVPLTVGRLTMSEGYFLEGAVRTVTVPVTAYLLIHPSGLTVFDTGLGPRFCRPDGSPQEGAADLEESGRIDSQIRAAGFDPDEVETVVNSHLHTDHAGGNVWLSHARVVVQASEWEYASTTNDVAYHRPEYDTGQDIRCITGELDLFDDGSVLAYPTLGHTPGHQSLRVQTTSGPVVLAGDACNLRRSLDEMWMPPQAFSRSAYRASLEDFARRREEGEHIFYSHDPEFWETVPTGQVWTGPA